MDLDRAPEEFLICPNYSDDLEATHLEKEETGPRCIGRRSASRTTWARCSTRV